MQRVRELIQSQADILKDLSEERENSKKSKETISELQKEVKKLKSLNRVVAPTKEEQEGTPEPPNATESLPSTTENTEPKSASPVELGDLDLEVVELQGTD